MITQNIDNGFLATFKRTLDFNRFAIMAMGMTAQSCLASIAVFMLMKHSSGDEFLIPLALLASLGMGSNAIALAQVGMKTTFGSMLISAGTSILMILYVLLFL